MMEKHEMSNIWYYLKVKDISAFSEIVIFIITVFKMGFETLLLAIIIWFLTTTLIIIIITISL